MALLIGVRTFLVRSWLNRLRRLAMCGNRSENTMVFRVLVDISLIISSIRQEPDERPEEL